MRILVMSDSHGRSSVLYEAIENEPTAAAVIFLGERFALTKLAAVVMVAASTMLMKMQ